MPKRTRDYRETLLESLRDPSAAASYLNTALEDSDEMFLIALRDVAEAHQFSKVASEAGLSRESIYRTLSGNGNPRYSSLIGILKAVSLKLSIEPNVALLSFQTHKAETYGKNEPQTHFESDQSEHIRGSVTIMSEYLGQQTKSSGNTISEIIGNISQTQLAR
jgi:probable addiction module antidote protein